MANSTTSGVYIHVVEDVINKVRDEFVTNGGPGEGVLAELQGIWEMKLMQVGAIVSPSGRSSAPKSAPGGPVTPVHDLNVPYEGTEEYETPTAEMLFPPTPLVQTPIQTPLPGTFDGSMYNIPTGPTEYPAAPDSVGAKEMKIGRPSPSMQPPSPWLNQRLPRVDVNVAYVEGREEPDRGISQPLTQDFFMVSSGKRKRDEFASQYPAGGYIPQQDGAGGSTSDNLELEIIHNKSFDRGDVVKVANGKVIPAQNKGSSSRIPQFDGPIPDPYDDMLSTPNIYNYQEVINEDYNAVNTPAPNDQRAGTPAAVVQNDLGDEDDDDEPPLNENDDDDLDDADQGEELNTQHLVLAQFDKVTRTKSKWKCTLKDGIMHINNKDILFNKATGGFDF
ncbi:hypothetical protein Nepgr_009235 [Nepenthes gracilis]|uniref:Uncharacterized protein n=1 Tax=Nepenthes gracilis TaxID=150966 RepID=A0AAD3XK59_NEPGR|nr:hypothetical protein Nepgr_009235 [Nepenthes gracilis]